MKHITMKLEFLLGVAAGVGATLFLTSERGKSIVDEWKGNLSDLADKGIDVLNSNINKAGQMGKSVAQVAQEQYEG
jgi:hypothetical protein